MVTFEKSDLDQEEGERTAYLASDPISVDIAYQRDDAGQWAIVVLIDCWDDIIGQASCPVAADLADVQLVELAREPLEHACADAARMLDQAHYALDRILPLFSS
jgi:hypothetical protein